MPILEVPDRVDSSHVSVLLPVVMEYLVPHDGGAYVDCTVNGGGHAESMLERSAPSGTLLGLDADPAALESARARLAAFHSRCTLVHANFRELGQILAKHGLMGKVDGVLFDLGLSSNELEHSGRGFSFQRPDELLDMRFDPTAGRTAADLLNQEPQSELERILREYGEEFRARRVARAILDRRRRNPFATVRDLLEVVEQSLGPRRSRLHPATKVFQAVRIATNDEIGALETGVRSAMEALRLGGRLAVIAFHSLEDRLVKQLFRAHGQEDASPRVTVLTKKPLTAGRSEVLANPRARSAKLRVAERI